MIVGTCTIELYLPGVSSLKEKRSIIKSMLARMHNTFNVSAAEVDFHDVWQSSLIGVAVVTNATAHADSVLDSVIKWIETHYPDTQIVRTQLDLR